jgi:hypothetical protein
MAQGGNPFPGMSSDEIINAMYYSVALRISDYFDQTSFEQPQGRRVLVQIKEGITDCVEQRKPKPNPLQIIALAFVLMLTPTQTAAIYGVPWPEEENKPVVPDLKPEPPILKPESKPKA